ncbi:magnesium transporter [Thioalkalivibrio sp. AKL12]|uniref:magnesium transporter n=1 Tax=Thioalkalivibrio sp. AKL12 TaxID=1158159 RepID=UPI0003819B97|nr:magnesium transporter [Thioalkalivibrio sp. AKL12]
MTPATEDAPDPQRETSVPASDGSATIEELLLGLQAQLAESDSQAAVCDFLQGLDEQAIALLLESFPFRERERIWSCIPQDQRGEVLAEVGVDAREHLMADMPVEEVTALAQDLPPETVAELLDTIDDPIRESVIETLAAGVRHHVTTLHGYDDDAVGRYMDPETTNVKPDVTLEAVQRFVRISHSLDSESQELLVTDKDARLVGSLRLVDLVRNHQKRTVADFMYMPTCLLDTMDIRRAATILRARELPFAPVVDAEGVLVGQLNMSHIMEIVREDADATLLGMAGVKEEGELFAPIRFSIRSRGIWLGINLATAFLAAYVIGQFEAVLSQVVALAVLMPVVASMGGIAGSQTLTVVIRGLAMGQIAGTNRWWLLNKELWVGLANGIIWALVVGLVAHLWFQDLAISLIITLAIIINMTVANVAGITIPLTLKRLGMDPALSGAVILTTVTDVVGFLSFLGLATLLILV